MPPAARTWRERILDVASSVFVPVAFFLLPLNGVLFPNSRELLYDPPLVRAFAVAGLAAWVLGFWIVRRFRGRIPARLWATVPWAVLALDVLGAALERWSVRIPVAAVADAAVIFVVLASAVKLPWSSLRGVAAVVGVALMAQGVTAHVSFVKGLSTELVVGSHRATVTVPPSPAAGAPGNVYHILLDNYLSESFSFTTGKSAANRFPGFTFYSRFNTNFPRTSSAEPGLLTGRFPTPGMSVEDWSTRAPREGLWHDLASANVGLWLYPYGRWLCREDAVKCLASSDVERDAYVTASRDATISLWAQRLLPASARRALKALAARSGTADSVTAVSVKSPLGALWTGKPRLVAPLSSLAAQYSNLKQFDELLADEARRPPRGQYVYYHAIIPHPDYILDEKCEPVPDAGVGSEQYLQFVACANLMIERLVSELARLNRLDDALIVVHADHGDASFVASQGWVRGIQDFALDPVARTYQAVDRTHEWPAFEQIVNGDSAKWRSIAVEVFSSGLLLVKFPHATAYTEDRRPVQLVDIAPTILAHFGGNTRSYDGLPFALVPPDREEVFYAHSRGFDGKFSKYRLTRDGWRFVGNVPVAK